MNIYIMAWSLSLSSASSFTSLELMSTSTSYKVIKVYTEMQDQGGTTLIKNGFQNVGITISITDALSMEYLMHDNPFEEDDLLYDIQILSYFVVFTLLS